MTASSDMRRAQWHRVAAVFGLVAMIVWTLTIKYVAPAMWTLAERAEGRDGLPVPIMWDFWPVAHGLAAWMLWVRHRLAWTAAVWVAGVEIVVVVVKFALFALDPDLTFWRLLWFSNKLYVLAFFVYLFCLCWRPWFRQYVQAPTNAQPSTPEAFS